MLAKETKQDLIAWPSGLTTARHACCLLRADWSSPSSAGPQDCVAVCVQLTATDAGCLGCVSCYFWWTGGLSRNGLWENLPGISLVAADTEASMITVNENVILPFLAASFPKEQRRPAFFPRRRDTSTISKRSLNQHTILSPCQFPCWEVNKLRHMLKSHLC